MCSPQGIILAAEPTYVSIFVLLFASGLLFAFTRSARRSPSGGGSLLGLLVGVAIAAVLMAMLWARTSVPRPAQIVFAEPLPAHLRGQSAYAPAQSPRNGQPDEVIPTYGQATALPDEPIDALWERLTAPRITLGDDSAAAEDDRHGRNRGRGKSEDGGDKSADDDDDASATTADNSRPAWLGKQPSLADGLRQQVVATDPFVTLRECHQQLLKRIDDKVRERLDMLADTAMGRDMAVGAPTVLALRIERILDKLVADQFVEQVDASVGPMQRASVLLKFSPELDDELLAAWKSHERQRRVSAVALAAGSVVGAVGLLFGLVKVDTATRGYYTKRLFLGVPAAIIGTLALLGFFA